MKTTKPVFIIGSGRSGTRMLFKLLSGNPQIEVYHEFVCTHIQPVAAKYFMKLMTKKQVKDEFKKLHGSSIFYSKADYWVDCSNKLSWIIEPILELFPNALFIHVTRDGRKVTSSFFHKLAPEIYDDESVTIMQHWLASPKKYPEPPPEKKYWWNIPQKGQPFYKEFSSFDQYQRICYHYLEVHRVIAESFKKIPRKNSATYKLEELTTDKKVLAKFLSHLGLELTRETFEFVQTPQNVFFPMDFKLTDNQLQQFNVIAGPIQKKLGYTQKEVYTVQY